MRKYESAACGFLALLLAAVAGDKTARAAEKPVNILVAIADDWGHGHAGAYGCRWIKTPGFDRVAREGLLFTRAYTPNAKCAPSRACFLTGHNPWQLGAACNHVPYFPPQFKTYAEALSDNDYFVGMTGKGWGPGVAANALGEPRPMTGRPFNRRVSPSPASGISRNDYAANFADFLEAAPRGKPWCFWYGALEPHRGFEYGSGAAKGGRKLAEIDRVPGYWPDTETVRNDLLDYAFEVEHFDRHFERMLEALERRGELDNTLVIVTSDHGMPFPRAKGQAYDFSNRVPLAILWRRGIRNPGRTVGDYVSLIDLAPTLIKVAGLDWAQTGMAPAAGLSVHEVFAAGAGGRARGARDHVLIGKERHDIGRPHDWGYPIRGIVKDDTLYLRNFEPARWPAGNPETGYLNCDGGATKTHILEAHRKDPQDRSWALCFGKRPAEELYDLVKDPDCLTNLVTEPVYARLRAQLERQLVDELTAQEDPRLLGQSDTFEKYPYANPAHRNFHERFMRGEKLEAGWVNKSDFEPAPRGP